MFTLSVAHRRQSQRSKAQPSPALPREEEIDRDAPSDDSKPERDPNYSSSGSISEASAARDATPPEETTSGTS